MFADVANQNQHQILPPNRKKTKTKKKRSVELQKIYQAHYYKNFGTKMNKIGKKPPIFVLIRNVKQNSF